ncbi:MAG: SDR family NAD(P)-dependent oxidoreductase [Gammaproteobacteria bacterium]|nr:SDR family NAD(P)-dependent oxidoreductase [Gammaproteobacteria bacterium]
MSVLNSFPKTLNVVVIGASGGIGSEFVRQLDDDERVAHVHALARNPAYESSGKIVSGRIDICDEDSINAAAAAVTASGKLDLVIVASGILHGGEAIQPEKSLRDIDSRAMMDVIKINAVGPALVAKAFLPHMRRGTKSVFAALSARVGSSSKAALNMILKTLSIEHARRFPESVVAGLHPGTVDTQLSAPFQRRVPEGKLFTTSKSVQCMLSVIDSLSPAGSGSVFAWDGSPIEH